MNVYKYVCKHIVGGGGGVDYSGFSILLFSYFEGHVYKNKVLIRG